MKDFYLDSSRVRSPQRAVLNDSDTPNMTDLYVPRMSFIFFVFLNWLLYTEATKDSTIVVLSSYGIPSRKFFSAPAWASKVYHLSHFTYSLAAVDLEIPLVMSKMLLEKLFRR